MKKWIPLFIILLIPINVHADESTWIIEVTDDPHDVKEHIEDYYPLVQIEYVYDTLMDAVAVTGKQRHIKDLHDEQYVASVNQVESYSVPNQKPEKIHPERARYHPDTMSYTGEGVKVGVIDTGIDYQHPDLEKNYQGGFDVVDFDEDPMETTPEDGMPTLHGTHVSGIIAGNGTMQGVAPDADIYSYRALGPGGSGTTAQIIAALEQAVKDGMDMVNMSLGSETNSPDDPMTKAVDRAVEMGTIVVVANGNSGPGDWTVGSPATSEKAISVGAAITEQEIPQIQTKDSNVIQVRSLPLTPEWDFKRDLPIEVARNPEDLQETIHDRVILTEKGDTPFYELIKTLEEKGATALIIYSHPEDDPNQWEFAQTPFPVAYVTEEEAQMLMEGDSWLSTRYTTLKNTLAPFSSRGPVASSWNIKPDLIAPGVEIVSTIPDGYASLQGTSMAAPYVTGVLALLKQAYPHDTPEQLKSRLLSSTELFKSEEGLLSPSEQGTGFIDTEKAVNQPYAINQNRLNFGKIEDTQKRVEQTIEVTNHESQPLTVRFDIPKRENGLIWDLPMTTTISPQTKRSFKIGASITPDRMAEGTQQGYLEMTLGGETKELPYLFINETSDYPRITGFEIDMAPFQQEKLTLRFYLNEKIDQLSMALVDTQSLKTTDLFTETDLPSGMFEKEFEISKLPKGELTAIFQIEQEGEVLFEKQDLYIPGAE
ncbi:S8 family serine peptidase [Aquisalibacillus elongatus]|uniref:Minor extracellular serine protease Vpr n=1 Tax=Aquisalibacillus elongatus TaxID=485577 RepID=A0A3N5B9F4_9BACI|nr:S8 family serine peptidase [Aquisalibacillus elongatus]RPF54104.1 minor extracellular serine protease Vpr [Aquisalibacillus elongatus]